MCEMAVAQSAQFWRNHATVKQTNPLGNQRMWLSHFIKQLSNNKHCFDMKIILDDYQPREQAGQVMSCVEKTTDGQRE